MEKILESRLRRHERRRSLTHHAFFSSVAAIPLDREGVGVILGQWWHPLHGFPDFLAATVRSVRFREKSPVARILDQELGEGDPAHAHENIYVETMRAVGFAESTITSAAPFPETRALVDGYQSAARSRTSALGFLYGTEVADLAMVSGIGQAVRRVTGAQRLPWVDIHTQQEPDHVECVLDTMRHDWLGAEQAEIESSAMRMWDLWIDFFSALSREIHSRASALEPAGIQGR